MNKITLDLDKLKKQIAVLKEIAAREKWIYFYEKMLDHLYFTPETIKSDHFLYSISDELSVYIDKNSNLKGIFIEYFKTNLISHEKELEGLLRSFKEKRNGSLTIPKKEAHNADLLSDALQAKMLSHVIMSEIGGQIQIPA